MITKEAIKIAYKRGYRVSDEGVLLSPYGNTLKISISKNQRYPSFSISRVPNVKNKYGVFGIPIHKFAAYCFYGEDAFYCQCVRHLNGNVLDVSRKNIALGTHSENNLDKNKEKRSSAAKKARAAQGKRPTNAKFDENQISYIRSAEKTNIELSKEFNVTRQCIYLIRKGKNYA
jgi:hypothetical protein